MYSFDTEIPELFTRKFYIKQTHTIKLRHLSTLIVIATPKNMYDGNIVRVYISLNVTILYQLLWVYT